MSLLPELKKFPLTTILAFVSALVLAACSSSSNDDMSNGMGGDTAGATTSGETTAGATPPFEPTFLAIRQNVFNVHCIVCHSGAEPPAQLSLESIVAYSNLVGVSSTEVPAILRVAAGDPDNSYLIQKLEGTAAVGAQMPFGATPLPAETIAVIREWISAGAEL